MKPSRQFDLAVVGAGIVGLAHALAAARQGLRVVIFERTTQAVGASVRNFGLLWPVGQPAGLRHERAMRSREIWSEVSSAAGLHLDPSGSLHLAYKAEEWALLQEFAASPLGSSFDRMLLTPKETIARSAAVELTELRGALWSPTEATVDPREAIAKLPGWLHATYGVELQFGTTVRGIELPEIKTTAGVWQADRVVICSGQDFETLYPESFLSQPITRCKLQMLRTPPQPDHWPLGPALCAGLTLTHYDSFKSCESLAGVLARARKDHPFHVAHGIHVLLSQTAKGELTIGDSHEYGLTLSPFDREDINGAIMSYLKTFAHAPDLSIAERWHGVYPKMTNGQSECILKPEPGVVLVNGLGGAGMTMSFGLAEETLQNF
ncbi:MAG: TIGR03364 family FAD-dependent oxidoreductase [Opitutaceae bacterium]